MIRIISLLAFACAAGPLPARAAISVVQPSQAEDLEMLANFFLPGEPFMKIFRHACGPSYRAALADRNDTAQLETRLPGIQDRMVAASAAHCEVEARALLERWHGRIKADWAAAASPEDISRLADLVATATAEAMSSDPITSQGTPADWDARWRAAQAAFARTPGGAKLLEQLSAYVDRIQAELADSANPMRAIVQGGGAAGTRAANAYAREKGRRPPYAED